MAIHLKKLNLLGIGELNNMAKKPKKRIGMKCIKFPYGETVADMIVHDNRLFVATSKNVYEICQDKAKRLKIKGGQKNGKKE
jgi:hypothetical protein